MTAYTIHSSRPHESILPRSHRDAHQRRLSYGPIQPMDGPPSLLARLFGKRP
ncbi:hypothetical protein [Novosphingobium malaysiense]|uniref:hypothetical protein n=1 Tax=Novosphingobium malaysiense TaxID=1348853 RepID=UPI000A476AF4|nr:hypothetical protein [Novosphingobium malaysiense]